IELAFSWILVEFISSEPQWKLSFESLIRIFYSLVERADVRLDNIGLDCNAFQMILHNIFGMTDDVLMNRVFFAFDKDNDNLINAKEWVKGLSVFLRGTFEEKLKFCFEVYYFNGDGYISREKIFDMLKNSLHQQSPEEETDEGITELVDITLKKMVRIKNYSALCSFKWIPDKAKSDEMIYIPSFFFVFCLFRAAPVTHGGSQAKGQIGAVAASLRHSHSNSESELCLRPTPQLTATPDPQPTG
uniref:EF-hand domain-containing protein n=1 Tax=Sus scrofa TaxID=9823 RepID=A0A8D2BZS2_PIG